MSRPTSFLRSLLALRLRKTRNMPHYCCTRSAGFPTRLSTPLPVAHTGARGCEPKNQTTQAKHHRPRNGFYPRRRYSFEATTHDQTAKNLAFICRHDTKPTETLRASRTRTYPKRHRWLRVATYIWNSPPLPYPPFPPHPQKIRISPSLSFPTELVPGDSKSQQQ